MLEHGFAALAFAGLVGLAACSDATNTPSPGNVSAPGEGGTATLSAPPPAPVGPNQPTPGNVPPPAGGTVSSGT